MYEPSLKAQDMQGLSIHLTISSALVNAEKYQSTSCALAAALADAIRSGIHSSAMDLKVEYATQAAARHRDDEQSQGSAPWRCMSEKFNILEPELR